MAMQIKDREIKILIADDETLLSAKLADFLRSKGFDVRQVQNGIQASEAIHEWKPQFVIYDLMLPDMNALVLLKELKSAGLLAEDKIRVFVSSGQNIQSNIRECMRLGAADFLLKPLKHEDFFMRLVLHLQAKREVSDRRSLDEDSAQYFMHLTDLLLRESLKGGPVFESLHNLTGMLAMALKAVRVSMIQCDRDQRLGWVIASSDKKSINNLQLDLGKYPEVMYVMNNEKPLALDNLTTDPTMHFVTQKDKEINFNSMIVSPVRIDNELWGVVSVRLPSSKERLSDFEIRYAQLAAHVMGLVLRQGSTSKAV